MSVNREEKCCHECGRHDNFCVPSCYPTHCHNAACKCHNPIPMTEEKKCCETPRKTTSVSTRKGRRAICNNCGAPWSHQPTTEEYSWQKDFAGKFYVYDLEEKTPAGAEKRAIAFIESLLTTTKEERDTFWKAQEMGKSSDCAEHEEKARQEEKHRTISWAAHLFTNNSPEQVLAILRKYERIAARTPNKS